MGVVLVDPVGPVPPFLPMVTALAIGPYSCPMADGTCNGVDDMLDRKLTLKGIYPDVVDADGLAIT